MTPPPTPFRIHPDTHPAVVIGALGTVAGLIVGVFSALGGHAFLNPYLDEIAHQTHSLGAIAVYALAILLYAVLSEAVLRRWLQRSATHRWGPAIGVLLPAIAVGLVHARYGWLQATYGVTIGLAAALCYHLCRRTTVLAAWHSVWDLSALGVVLVWAAYSPGPARNAMVFQHKTANVESGRLVYHPTRGWLDGAHYWETRNQLCKVYGHLSQNTTPAPITLRRVHAAADGGLRTLRVRYTFTPGVPTTAAPWRAAGVALDMAHREEQFQAAAHPLTGLAMSAYSFEDLPSAMAAALDTTRPTEIATLCRPRAEDRIPGTHRDDARWAREGRRLVATLADSLTPTATDPPATHDFWQHMKAQQASWQATDPAE